MALSESRVLSDIGEITSDLQARQTKYIRNYNMYVNNGYRRDQIENLYNPPQGYWYTSIYADTGPVPVANVLRSIVDTLDSKLAQTTVRPFFNPVNGLWTTRKAARGAQQFFDLYFDQQHLYHKGILCRRDAGIFDMGVMRINEETGDVDRIPPWQYFFDRAEYNYGELTRCFFRFQQYPMVYLKDKEWLPRETKERIESNPIKKCEYVCYYDLAGGKKHWLIDGKIIANEKIEFDKPPAIVTFNTAPVKGAYTTSTMDNQYTVQTMIDMILERIELAVELNPANAIFLPEQSNIKKSMFSNEIGAIYEYRPSPMENAVPVILTPPAISDQYMEMLRYFIQLAYEMEGISQLSAQSVKPSGLNSGVALQTVQDVESDRFEVLLQDHTRFFMEITERIIDIFPRNTPLLPKMTGRTNTTWADVQKQRSNFSIQFASASALSKDPMVKMQQIEKLISMKAIAPDMAPEFLEFPDLEKVESEMTAVQDVVESIIERAIEKGQFEYDLVVPGQVLEQAVLVELFHLDAVDENQKEIDNLREFYEVVRENNNKMKAAMEEANAPPPQPPAPQGPPQGPPGPQPQGAPMQPPMAQGPTNQLPVQAPQQMPQPGVQQ